MTLVPSPGRREGTCTCGAACLRARAAEEVQREAAAERRAAEEAPPLAVKGQPRAAGSNLFLLACLADRTAQTSANRWTRMCFEDEQWEAEEAEAEVIHLAMTCAVKSSPRLHEYSHLSSGAPYKTNKQRP